MSMDSVINSALEEICARGANGILVSDLWPSLGPVLSSSNLPLSASIKRTIWNRLVSLPVLRFDSDGGSVESRDSRIECLDESEGLGLRIVAGEELRSSFVGLDDLNAANAKISEEQRRTLDRIAAARTNGITQNDLAKEFGIKGNNFFYQVRNLESQQLIVRQSITVRAKEVGDEVVNGQKNNHISTNLIHLYRYGKAVNLLNSQQRIEITKPAGLDMLGSVCMADKTYDGDFHHGERVKEDLVIKDYLPAMKAVCDKLEEANEKILVVSDVKVALGYRKYRGHKAWRNIVNRLEDAGLVKRFQAEVNGADVECLRLLKKFDSNDFQSKPTPPAYDGLDSETSVKHGKRGHITDQFLELPMENCVYDMVDSEGPKGITVFEVCKRLGLNSKKMNPRIASMCLKFGMRMESEKPNRTLVYRVWTPQNHKLYLAGAFSGKCQEVPSRNGLSTKSSDIVPYDQSSSDVQVLDSSIQDEDLHSQMQKTHSAQGVPQLLNTCDGLNADSQLTICCMVPQNLTHEFPIANDNTKLATSKNATNPSIVASGSHLSASPTTSKQTPRNRSFASTMIGGRRKQWILERLKDDKFILHGELYRWLKDLETDKPTMMDRKTLDRTLNVLQKDGLCRINQVKIPAVTNFSRTREQAVILHPSIDCISSDLLNEIYNSYKDFELKSHSRESGKYGNQPLTVLTGIERSSNPVDDKPVTLEAMRANGYVQAKMVRAKLLHQYLWAYISSLPDWQNTLPSAKDDRSVNCHRKTCQFSMSAAIQAMPLELFLQIVGSAKGIDDMVQRCRIGSRLMDLSIPEYKCVLDTHATARLSRIINILLLLKLTQLAWQGPADVDLPQHSISTHTMELETYIEEPSPRVPPSLQINSVDLHPKIRHDFVFSKQEDVNAYWEILEYCYATADPVSASLSFPGSVVHEVFNRRSWASVRVMTAEQRMELLKRMEIDNLEKRIPFKECVEIARELNLSVEQVLRVSYDKQQKRAQRTYKISNSKKQEICMDTNSESVLKKRRLSEEKSVEHAPDSTSRETFCVHGDNMDRDSSITNAEVHDNLMETCTNTSYDNPTTEFEPHEEDDQSLSFIKSRNLIRQRRFTWTDEFDRQLVMQYARYRVIMGERFSRVIWSSVRNLPTDPLACGRRMNKLNSDMSTRRAVMRLCNLLGERYGRYLNNGRTVRKNILNLGDSAKSIQQARADETIDRHLVIPEDTETSFRQSSWDDFDHPDIKMAVDEVLRCKKMTKAEHTKKSGARHGQGCLDTPTEGTNLDFQEHVTPTEHISASHAERNVSHCETGTKNSNILQISDQSRSISHHSRRKFLKLSNSRRIEIERKVCESTTVANAVELLKLVFLSNSAVPEGQTSLAETLQLYPKSDLIAAFNYLREKEYVVIRNGNQPLLSQKFWHNASSSPFPVDSGKRAASFSSWLHEKDKYLKDGIDLGKDVQCGEIFHLFAFIASGEVLISPTLPEEGIGEADESKSSQCLLTADDDLNYLNASSNEAEIPCDGEKDKKQKSLWKVDSDFCSRREKGFPGIKVFINCATIPRVDALQCVEANEDRMCSSIYSEMKRPSYSDIKSVTFESLSSRSSLPDNSGCEIQLEGDPDRLPCYEMSRYAEHLAAVMVGSCGVFKFCPELFRSVCCVIDKAGEQGLSVEEISRLTGVQEGRLTEVVVETLEIFQLAFKVNAYDCVRVVASSHGSKYFIGLHADLASCENDKGMRLSDGHKLTRLDKPPKPGVPQVETQLSRQSLTSDECNQINALRNESENRLSSVAGVSNGHQSILPWINGDGSTNSIVYKGLTRRALGTVMQNPGILEEDIIHQMDVLNPQSCRRLLERMALDNHLITRMAVRQSAPISPPSIVHSLFQSDFTKQRQEFRKHYFANPMSASLL